MKRLEESKLIFGRMMRVSEPHLIERYNQALKGFGLKQTKLNSFRIDMTGFSPEVADELGDRQYLDPERDQPPIYHSLANSVGGAGRAHGVFQHRKADAPVF